MKKLTLVALILSSLMWIHCTPSGPETTNKQGNIPSSTGGGGSNPPPVGDTVQPPPSTGGGDTTQPPPSGDGETTTSQTITKILFETSSNDATRTLSTMDLDGTHISPLAIPGHSYITASEPSPDGNYIAFVSTKENGGQIWIWNRKTSQTTRLTDIAPTDYFIQPPIMYWITVSVGLQIALKLFLVWDGVLTIIDKFIKPTSISL